MLGLVLNLTLSEFAYKPYKKFDEIVKAGHIIFRAANRLKITARTSFIIN